MCVEVRGTTSGGVEIVLTRREVEEAALPKYTLFVCSGSNSVATMEFRGQLAAGAVSCARGTSVVIG